MRTLHTYIFVSGLLVLARTAPAQAQEADTKHIADTLFEEARNLEKTGHLPEACAKFAASQDADPSTGTMLNLADCYERLGRTASAYSLFRDTAHQASREGRTDREAAAVQRADALEPNLSKMTIFVDAYEDGLTIRRNGELVDKVNFSVPQPLDPGTYTIEAAAPGKKPWTRSIVVAAAGNVTVHIPRFDSGEAPAVLVRKSTWSTERTLALVAGGIGVAGAGVGTVLGLGAISSFSHAKSQCTPAGCDSATLGRASNAAAEGNLSTVAFIAGGALFATGLVLWFTSPKEGASVQVTPTVGPHEAAVVAQGRF